MNLLSMASTGARPAPHLLLLTLFAFSAGCGSGLPMAPVRGTVTVEGKPLVVSGELISGMVTFVPDDTQGYYAYGKIGPDGTYELTTNRPGDGAVLGSYHIMVSASEYASPDPEAAMWPLLHEKYGSNKTSGLTAVVTDQKENVVDLDLKPRLKGGKPR